MSSRHPAARRSPRPPRARPTTSEDPSMATVFQALFTLGTITLAIGFAAHVGHAVLFANGRRALAILTPHQQPAYAGVATGNFVTSQTETRPTPDIAASSPLGRAASVITLVAFAALL